LPFRDDARSPILDAHPAEPMRGRRAQIPEHVFEEHNMSATQIPTLVPTGTWTVDPAHTNVEFQVKHLGIATVRGAFNAFEGTLEIGADLASAVAHGSVEAASVDTNEEQRDAHLRSPDFFDAESHPKITFRSKAIRSVGDDAVEIVGDLTLHGVTKEIVLHGEVQGTETDPWGNDRVGLEITGQLSRGDFGMTFNQALGSGNVLVSDKVKLRIDVSAVRQA
jgi:polyisoprenoid-binding protein YceI